MANYLLNKPKNLYLSSFKLINRFVINEIIKHNSPFIYLDGLILGTTNKIGKIKVDHSNRLYGKSGYTFIKMLKLWSNMSTSFSIFPLRLSMLMGVVLSFIGFILAIIIFFQRIFDNTVPSGFASIFVKEKFYLYILQSLPKQLRLLQKKLLQLQILKQQHNL